MSSETSSSGVRLGVSANGTVYWNIEVEAPDGSLKAMHDATETAILVHAELSERFGERGAR